MSSLEQRERHPLHLQRGGRGFRAIYQRRPPDVIIVAACDKSRDDESR